MSLGIRLLVASFMDKTLFAKDFDIDDLSVLMNSITYSPSDSIYL